MSRSNPFIEKPRQANWTVLAIGEGETEKAFLQFLKGLYNRREDSISIKLAYAGGGNPECVIDHAIKLNPKTYDHAFVLLDQDVPCRPSYQTKARKNRLELIWCVPCVEGLFLKILEPAFYPPTKTTSDCKRLLEDKYLGEREKLDPEKYAKIFSRDLLEDRRGQVVELDRIVRLMTEKRR
jgi:hypothetical protein